MNQFSKHHILPKSMGGSDNSTNTEMIKDTTHRAIHTLFENKMIAEQLIRTVELSEKALKEDVRKRLLSVLTEYNPKDPFIWYKEECIK